MDETATIGREAEGDATASLLRHDPRAAASTAAPTLAAWTVAAPGGGAAGAAPAGPAYELQRLVGRGGMGEVWAAVQVSLGRAVAVKRIRPDRADQSSAAEFRHEAAVSAQLEHPNIVPVHDLGQGPDGEPMLAMKLVRGKAWSELMAADFPAMEPRDFLARHVPILVDVAQAVAFAHSRGIVHRDLKPAQAMVGDFGEVLLMDWGLAIFVGEAAALEPHQRALAELGIDTASNPSGTPALMAPEQTLDTAHRIGTWTDVYLLGATLYFLLTGTYPHQAPTPLAAIERAARGAVEPPRTRAPGRDIPRELEDLCLRAMAREPIDRVSSAAEFAAALQDFLGGSSKRRESAAIAAEAERRLAAAAGDYRELADCLSRIADAAALWGENPRVAPLRDAALSAYAESALGGGDLRLARIQGEQVADAAVRGPLVARVAAAEAEALRLARQRRMAVRGAAGLGAAAIAILAGATWMVSGERDQARASEARAVAARRDAEKQRDLAARARTDSDALVRFMVSDLRERIKPLDPELKVLDEVALRARDHYLKQPAEELAPAELAALAEGLDSAARILRQQGRHAEASAAFDRRLEVVRRAVGATPSPDDRAALAFASFEAGMERINTGKQQEGVALVREAMAAWKDVVPGLNDPRRWREYFESAGEWGKVCGRIGLIDEMREAFGVGLLSSEVAAQFPEDDALALIALRADVAMSVPPEDIPEYEADYIETARAAKARSDADPQNLEKLERRLFAEYRLAALYLSDIARRSSLLDALRSTIATARELLARDTTNFESRELLVRVLIDYLRFARGHAPDADIASAGTDLRRESLALIRRDAASIAWFRLGDSAWNWIEIEAALRGSYAQAADEATEFAETLLASALYRDGSVEIAAMAASHLRLAAEFHRDGGEHSRARAAAERVLDLPAPGGDEPLVAFASEQRRAAAMLLAELRAETGDLEGAFIQLGTLRRRDGDAAPSRDTSGDAQAELAAAEMLARMGRNDEAQRIATGLVLRLSGEIASLRASGQNPFDRTLLQLAHALCLDAELRAGALPADERSAILVQARQTLGTISTWRYPGERNALEARILWNMGEQQEARRLADAEYERGYRHPAFLRLVERLGLAAGE